MAKNRNAQPRSIYPGEDIWDKLKVVAKELNRSRSEQAVRFIKFGISRYERKKQQGMSR
jgi:hypothetical protein